MSHHYFHVLLTLCEFWQLEPSEGKKIWELSPRCKVNALQGLSRTQLQQASLAQSPGTGLTRNTGVIQSMHGIHRRVHCWPDS